MALVSLLLSACASNEPADPHGPPARADGVAVDSFIVMRHADGIHLVDPTTGKTSPGQPAYYAAPISAIEDGFAIAPDGQHIAWVKTLGTVVVGQATIVDGGPVLEIVAEYPEATYQGVKWSPDGDRLVTTHKVIDPATSTVWACPDDEPGGNPIVLNDTMVVFPGSHRYVCPDGFGIYADGNFVGRAGEDGDVVTADGQLYGLNLHMPSASRAGGEVSSDLIWDRGDLPHFQLPDGKTLVPPGDAGAAADDGYVYDLPAIHRSRVWSRSMNDRWFMKEALDPFLHEADIAAWSALALQDNGRAVVFGVTSYTLAGFPPEAVESDVAVVEVARGGTARGFITSPLMDDESYVRLTGTVYDLTGDDLLVAGWTPKDNGQEPHLVGYVGGKQTHYRGFDRLTPDGRWLYGFRRYTPNPNEGGEHCFYDRKGHKATCFPQNTQGTPIGFMGQGVKAGYDDAAPAISGVSRTGAWPGAEVVVFGAHFGTAGTLTLGGVVVQTASWSSNEIRFRMPASGGVVVVENAYGTSGYRDFHVGVSALIATPFSGMTTSEVSVGQGINLLDLGEVTLDDAAFVSVGGQYAVHASGASPPRTADFTLHAGGATRALRIHQLETSVDPTAWQLAAPLAVTPDREPRLADVGGSLIEVIYGLVPFMVDERLLLDTIDPRIFFGGGDERGLPDFWRNDPSAPGAWTASRFAENSNVPWSLRRLTGWESTAFGRRPVYAAAPRATLPSGHRGVAGSGQAVITVGAAGSYQMSSDGGETFNAYESGTVGALREPLFVEAATPFFLVLEPLSGTVGVRFHAVELDGTFNADVQPALADMTLSRPFEDAGVLDHATQAGKVALWFGLSHTLHIADFDGAAGWTSLTNVRSIFHDGDGLYVVMLDGQVQLTRDWKTFEPFDLGIVLAVPLRVEPLTVQKLAGRWLVLAKLFDDAAPSALAPSGFLLGPEAP